MTEDFATYVLAVKLKEKGFRENVNAYYGKNENIFVIHPSDMNDSDYSCSAPTISQVLKWLREEKNIHIEIYTNASGYNYIISDTPKLGGSDKYWSKYEGPNDSGCWDFYEECVIAGIEYCLDNLI